MERISATLAGESALEPRVGLLHVDTGYLLFDDGRSVRFRAEHGPLDDRSKAKYDVSGSGYGWKLKVATLHGDPQETPLDVWIRSDRATTTPLEAGPHLR